MPSSWVWFGRRWIGPALLFLLLGRPALSAAVVSDFQARLNQTTWNLQQTEGILRSQPHSTVPVNTPEALGSYLALLSENVTALCGTAGGRVTDEQRRTMAEGLKTVANALKDQMALANNRGLTAAASAFGSLEATCRSAILSI